MATRLGLYIGIHQIAPLITPFQRSGILRLIIPSRCAACGHWPSRGLCESCLKQYNKAATRCQHCAIELPQENTLQICGQCLETPFTFDRAIAAVSYVEPWSTMLLQFKLLQHTEKAHTMAQLLHHQITQSNTPLPDILIPIPNAKNRMSERGYNQAWQLTKSLARQLKIQALPTALIRSTEESSQTQRKRRERIKALKNAFAPNPKYSHILKDKHIALIDDVMTTGATLESAAKVLKHQANTRQISAWVFARTPQERHSR